MTEMTQVYDWQGRDLVDASGDKVGTIDEIYDDQRTGKPEWALVHTGLLGTKSHFVPMAGASASGENVSVSYSKDEIKNAPSIDGDGELSQDEERRLFEHYGVPYTDEGSVTAEGASPQVDDTGQAARDTFGQTGRDTSRSTTDDAMTRSEEELRVGTVRRESGRVRLRKHVITEQVTKTVPVAHEEIRLEREPITDENRGDALEGPEISEEEHEVVLHEEQPVVEKRTVAKERVRLGTDAVSDERQVTEEVRKERIETDRTDGAEGADRAS